MRKTLLAGAGALVIAVSAFAGSAQAQCWWNGFGYSCAAGSPVVTYNPYTYPYAVGATPYAAWNSWDYRDYRYQPSWLPSHPGPKPSSSTFGGW